VNILRIAMSLVLLFSGSFAHCDEHSLSDIKVTAVAAKTATGAWQLSFSMINNSDHPVRIFEANLPWGVRTSLTLLLVPAGIDQTPLAASHYIDDPGPQVIVIAAHSEVAGTVNLDDRCPGLGKVNGKHDVLAFWSYELPSADGVRGQRTFGGALLTAHRRTEGT
jgi:hypothetical protein